MAKKDKETLALIQEVRARKKEIISLERPVWKTDCSFCQGGGHRPVNLQVESSIFELIKIAAFIRQQEIIYTQQVVELKITDAPTFTHQGFSANDWVDDIKTRIAKIQITSKKKTLEALEARLSAIISPELRAEMELEDIKKALS